MVECQIANEQKQQLYLLILALVTFTVGFIYSMTASPTLAILPENSTF